MIIPFITAILNRFKGDNTISKGWWFLFMIPLILFASVDPVVIVCWALYLAVYAVPPTASMLSCMMGRSQTRTDGHWQWMYNATLVLRGLLPMRMTINETWRVSTIFYGFFRGLPCVIPVGLLYGYTDDPMTLVGLLLLLQGLPYYVFKKLLMQFPNHGDMPVVYAELTIGYFLGVYLGVL